MPGEDKGGQASEISSFVVSCRGGWVLTGAFSTAASPARTPEQPKRRKKGSFLRMRRLSKRATILSLALTLVLAGGIGFTLWSSTGSGSGNAKAITPVDVTVSAVTGTADLYPGFTAGDLYFTLTNTNSYDITFTSMTPGTITTGAAGCAATDITVASASGLSIVVGAGSTSGTLSIADVVSMVSAAPDACKGATFTVGITLSGAQS